MKSSPDVSTDTLMLEVLDLFKKTFTPLYSDLLSAREEMPGQIQLEVEHALSHLRQAYTQLHASDTHHSESCTSNIKKAYHHILRASLDLAKLLAKHYTEKLNERITQDDVSRLCFDDGPNEGTIILKHRKLQQQSIEARKGETARLGVETMESIAAYRKIHAEAKRLLDQFQQKKYDHIKKQSKEATHNARLKEILVNICSLILSSIAVYLVKKHL